MRVGWKSLILTLVIGWFLGAASGLVLLRYCHTPALHEMRVRHMRRNLYAELNLSPEQQTQVEAILQTNRQKLDQIFVGTLPQVEGVRDATKAQIRQLLTPAQQARFDRVAVQWDARFERHLKSADHHWRP